MVAIAEDSLAAFVRSLQGPFRKRIEARVASRTEELLRFKQFIWLRQGYFRTQLIRAHNMTNVLQGTPGLVDIYYGEQNFSPEMVRGLPTCKELQQEIVTDRVEHDLENEWIDRLGYRFRPGPHPPLWRNREYLADTIEAEQGATDATPHS